MAEQKNMKTIGFALAAIASTFILVVGVYFIAQGKSNGADEQASFCPPNEQRNEAIKGAAVGEVAAVRPSEPQYLGDLSVNGDDGNPVKLSSMAGKTLLVNLWASWCVPCREEMPALDRLQQNRGGDDFAVVAINIDTGGAEKAKKFLNGVDVKNLAFYSDKTMGIFNEFKRRSLALGLPATALVDSNSCLIAQINGPAAWDSAQAVNLIDVASQFSPEP